MGTSAEKGMSWTCEQTEARLSDYLDELMSAEERREFDMHVNACARCTPMVSSVTHLLSGLHAMPQLEAPPRLTHVILEQTLGPRASTGGWKTLRGWLRTLSSPRFAYGAVSVGATFMILLTATGFSWRRPKLADLAPANLYRNADRQAHLAYARSTKFVSDLRVVYEIQARFRQDNEIPAEPETTVPQSAPGKQPDHTDRARPSSPNQQNRANGLERHIEVLASELPLFSGELSNRLLGRRTP
jgi:Putative zinc-finger